MKANELRINNLVEASLKSGQGRKRFINLTINDMVKIIENKGCFNYEPIPLTESIISKTEFEYMQDGWYKFNGFTWNIYDKGLRYNGVHLGEPDYLHTLQNIIFAISGEELDITNSLP